MLDLKVLFQQLQRSERTPWPGARTPKAGTRPTYAALLPHRSADGFLPLLVVMSFFSKSDTKPHLAVSDGHVLFPPPNSNEQDANGASGAILRDGKIIFSGPPSPSPDKKPEVQR